TRDDLVIEARMPDADDPRLSSPIADDAGIAAGVQHGVPDAVLAQDRRAALDRIPLRDAAEVDAHARLRETDRRGRPIDDDVPPVDRREPRVDLLVGRAAPLP